MRQTSSPTQDAQIRIKIKYRKQRLRAFLHVASDADAPKALKINEFLVNLSPCRGHKAANSSDKGKNSKGCWKDCMHRQLGIQCDERSGLVNAMSK